MKIGVFDSGIGGLSVARAIQISMPEHEIVFADDTTHLPYGSKTPEEILGYVEPVLRKLVDSNCAVIVIACNTVSTTLTDVLRQRFNLPLVAVEPMVREAAEQTKSGIIAVCATPTTLNSQRYTWLKAKYAKGVQVLEPDCSDWAYMIEHKSIDIAKIRQQIEEALSKKADVIVLGCTHYHWIEEEIKVIAKDQAVVLQPEQTVIRELKQVIARLA